MAKNHLMHIAGEQVSAVSGETEPVINPATAEQIATAPVGGSEDVERAVRAADKAFDAWADTPPNERSELLLKLADRLEQHAEEFAQLESLN
ncbi:MAG: aldehyde dehydrogenase family protein, partial [Comamonadaceae bacterium]